MARSLLFLGRPHREAVAPIGFAPWDCVVLAEAYAIPRPYVDVAPRPRRPGVGEDPRVGGRCGSVVPKARRREKDSVAGVVQTAIEVPTFGPRFLYV